MSKVEVDKVIPQSGTTLTIGDSGDTINLVGTLQSNGSPLPGDISSVVAGTGLSGGGTTGAVTLNIEAAQPTITSLGTLTGLDLTDNSKIRLGTSNDLEIFHNSTSGNSFIRDVGTGMMILGSDGTGVLVQKTDGETMGKFLTDGAVELYHNNVKKFETTSTGATVTTTLSGANDLNLQTSDANEKITLDMSGTQRFNVNGSEKMRLTTSGLGIGHSAPTVTLDVRKTSFTPYNTNTSLIVEAPAVFSQAQHFYIYNAGAYNSSRPTGGIGAVNASSLISLSAGSICNANPGADGFKATATSSSLYDIGSGNHEFKTKTGLTVGDQFTHVTRMIIKDSGRVGIGETSPDTTFHVNGGTTVAKFERDSGTNGSLTIGFPSTRATFDASGDLSIKNGGTERVRFHSGGIISATQGIALGVGTASTASNVLDDYEEGTWTPVYKGGSTAGSSPSGGGTYTKIGNLVHVDFSLVNITSTGASGDAIVAGLPFVCNQTNSTRGSFGGGVRFYNHELTGTSRYVMNTFIDDGNSHISFIQSGDATPWTSLVVDNDSGMYIEGAITYRTDA